MGVKSKVSDSPESFKGCDRINERFPMQEIEKVLKKYGWRLKSACGGYYPEQKKDELTITVSRKDGGVVGMGAVAQFV